MNLEAEVTRKLSGGVALRHERYSDFGNTTSAKGSARYAFTDALSLRGTASSGFRAPSLAQQYYTITTTNFQVINGTNTPIETGTFAVNTPQARALGAQDLKPEKARNYSLGLQFQRRLARYLAQIGFRYADDGDGPRQRLAHMPHSFCITKPARSPRA